MNYYTKAGTDDIINSKGDFICTIHDENLRDHAIIGLDIGQEIECDISEIIEIYEKIKNVDIDIDTLIEINNKYHNLINNIDDFANRLKDLSVVINDEQFDAVQKFIDEIQELDKPKKIKKRRKAKTS